MQRALTLLLLSTSLAFGQGLEFHYPVFVQAPPGQPRAFSILRQPPLAYPYDKSWAVSVYWDKDGNHFTDASLTISGRHEDTPDSHGHYPIRRPLPNYMLGVWSDVDAPSFVHRGNDLSNSCFLVNLHPITGAENLRVRNDGSVKAASVEAMNGANGEFKMGKFKVTIRGGIIISVEKMPVSQRMRWMFRRWKMGV
jgi:hypothetical protein